ncbi:MAG: histidine kinase [Ignavibacteria bacterium]|jgi:LytS/YehU family sensor histidine kinase|nr:histidine kinase [Ignavibacteria bacterium]
MKKPGKNKLFWILNFGGWTALYLLILFIFYPDKIFDFKTPAGLGITYYAGFLLSICLRYIYRKIGYKNRSIVITTLWIILISVITTVTWFFSDALLSTVLIGSSVLSTRTALNIAGTIISRIPTFVAWSGFYYIINLWFEWNFEKQRAEKADLLAHKAQLQMLRYQLNPHFLFNALNTIKALVEEDKNKAKDVITKLSEFLRYSLLSRNYSKVPLKNELEAIMHYLEIQKIRYEEKLEIYYNIEKSAEEFPVLSFFIYPLVENAVKYGMRTSKLPLKIWITARASKDELEIIIKNTGKWVSVNKNIMEIESGTGTGIENVKDRLENAYRENFSFNIEHSEGSVGVTIKIKQNET